MPEAWQNIPTSVIDFDKRRQQADDWALEQRTRTAEMWAQDQRRIGQSMIEQFAPQLAPYLPAPYGQAEESGFGLRTALAGPSSFLGGPGGPPGAEAGLGVQPPPSPGLGAYEQEIPYQESRPQWQMPETPPAGAPLGPTYGGPSAPAPGGGLIRQGLTALGTQIVDVNREQSQAQDVIYENFLARREGRPSRYSEQEYADAVLYLGGYAIGMTGPLKTPGGGIPKFGRTAKGNIPADEYLAARKAGGEIGEAAHVEQTARQRPTEAEWNRQMAAEAAAKAELPPPPAAGPYGATIPGVPGVRGEIGIPGDISKPLRRPGYAGNIKLDRIGPPELQQFVQDTVSSDEIRAEMARRGVMGDDLVRQIASEMGEDAERLIRYWKPGQAVNAEQMVAVKMALDKKVAVATAMSDLAGQSNNAQNVLRVRQSVAEATVAQMALHGNRAEAGRALRASGIATDALKSNNQRVMEQAIKTLGGRELTEAEALGLSTLDKTNPEAVYQFLRQISQSKDTSKLLWFWMNSILSGPKTHMANILSNTASAISAPVERTFTAAAEAGIAPISGRARSRFFGEAPVEVKGMIAVLPDAGRAFLQVLRKGYSADDIVKLEMRRIAPVGGATGAVVGAPGRLLVAEDAFFRTIMQEGAYRAEAYRIAAREGLKGEQMLSRFTDLMKNRPDELVQKAGEVAAYRLFQAPLGTFGKAALKVRSAKIMGGEPLHYVIPFLQTPINIAKFGLERSPLAMPRAIFNVARNAPEAPEQFGRAMMGSILAAGIGSLIQQGKIDITAEPPISAAERDRWYREGKQPFSVRIGDSWISYQRLEPLNQTLAQVGAVVNALRAGDDKTAFDKGATAVASIAKNMVSQTYLAGLSGFMDAASDPARYGAQFAENLISGFVPFSSLGRTIVQATDPTVRQRKGFAQSIQANIPGLAQQLPAKLTAFGEPSMRTNTAFERAIVPYQRSAANQSAVDAELERLGMNIGFVGNSIGGVKLTAEQQRQYQTLAGQRRRVAIERVISSAEYRSSRSDSEKESLIRRASEQARSQAAAMMEQRNSTLRGQIQRYAAGVR